MKKIYLILMLLCIAAGSTLAQPPCPFYHTNWPAPTGTACPKIPCGIYYIVTINWPNISGVTNYVNYPQYYDGIYIRLRWDQLFNAPGGAINVNMDVWPLVRDIFTFAQENGKQVSIGVNAGEFTPPYVLSYPGVNEFINQSNVKAFGTYKCENLVSVPVPFVSGVSSVNVYVNAYNSMMDDFKSILSTTITTPSSGSGLPLLSLVTMVKLCGINMTTEETRLPVEDDSFVATDNSAASPCPGTGPTYCASNMVSNWVGAGYTPNNIINAWLQIQQHTKLLFPDKVLNFVAIPDPKAFPPIDGCGHPITACATPCSTCTGQSCTAPFLTFNGADFPNPYGCHRYNYRSNGPDYCKVTDEMIHQAAKYFAPCLAVNGTALTDDLSTAFLKPTYSDIELHAILGYQEENSLFQGTYLGSQFDIQFDNGLNGGATFFELHPITFNNFGVIPCNDCPTNTAYDTWLQVEYAKVHRRLGCFGLPHRMAAENTISISIKDDALHLFNMEAGQCHYTIYDMSGRSVYEQIFTAVAGENVLELKNFGLQPSAYMFKMDCGKNPAITQKLILK